MNWLTVYLFCKMEAFAELFAFFGVLGLIVSAIFIIIFFAIEIDSYREENKEKAIKKRKTAIKAAIICFIVLLFAIAIPTKKEIATIIILPKIANSEIVKELPNDILDFYGLAKQYLKEQLTVENKTEQK
jgi:amino acid transporter